MSDYTLNIIVNGVDQTGPAQQGMDRLGVGGIAAGNLIAGALQSAAGAVTGFVGSAVSAAGDFQQNLNVLQAASGATSAQMDQMRQMAVALGNDMTLPGASASDAATAMLELSKAGLSVTDTMDAAKGTLQLAAAAETDAATAAQVVSGALNAFGLSGEHATEIADQLAAGANASAASMTDLSDGFKQAGFAFNATGQSTADLISGLAMLTNVGLTGSDAGTALKNAMLQLMAPTDAAAKTMAQYGINVRDAQGNMLPFRDIIGVLDDKLGGLSAAQREMALKTILQGDGMKALLPLLDAGVEGFDAMKAKVMVAGAAEEMAAAKMEGFKGAMGGLSNAVDTLKLAIGTALLPVLTFLINTIASPAINAVTNFIMALQGNADAIGQMSAPMQMLMGFLGSVWAASAQVVEAFNSAGTYSLQFALALGQLGMAFGLPAELLPRIVLGVQSFIDAIWPALDAIGAFVIGTGDLGTVADFLIDLLGVTLGGILTDAIGVLMSYAQVWIDLGATIFNVASALMSGDLTGAWAALTSGLAQVVADYQFYAQSMGALVLEIVNAIVTAVITYAPMIYAQLLTWGQAFVDWITPYIPIALTYLQSYAASIWAWIVEQAPILYQQVLTWGQAFVDWITPYIPIALTYLQTFAASVWAWIVEQAPILYQQVLTWGQAFVDWITPYAGLALAVLGEWVAGLWAWVQQQAPIWLTQLLTWGQALVDWVVPYIPIALAALQEFGASVLTWVGEQAGALLASFSAWADSVVAWIPGAIVSFLGAWPGMLGSFLDWIAGAVGPILAQLGAWAIAFVQWILPMIPPFIGGLAVLAGALLGFIVETAVVIATKVVAWATSFLGWIAVNVLPVLPGLLATILASILTFIGGAVVGIALSVAGWGLAFLAWIKDVIPKVPGALASILRSIISSITGMSPAIMDAAIDLGKNIISGIISGVKAAGGALLDAMKGMASSALSAAKSALGIASPSKVMAAEVGAPIVDGIVAGLVQRSPKAVQAMLDLANSMFDVVNKGVEAFGKLTQLGTIPQSAIANFGDAIMRTLTEFSQRVGQWDKAAMSAASQFTYKAGQVVEFLAKGVELLNGIATMAVPSQGAIRAFADALAMVMSEIVRVSTFELRLGLTAGVEFASGAKAIAEMIGAGVDALNKLSDFVRPAPGVIQTFVDVLGWLVSRIVLVAQWFDGQALGAAAAFAGATKQIMEVVGAGVDGLLKLAEFVKPAPGVIQTFADTLGWLVSRFVTVGGWFSGPALAAAGAFADSAGKVVGVIAAGVDGLLKLGEFVRPAPGVIDTFTGVVWWLVSRFAEAASWMTGKALQAAVAFAEGAGKVLGIIKAGIEGLNALRDFKAMLDPPLIAFANAVDAIVWLMYMVAEDVGTKAVDAAAKFSEGAGKVLGILKAGADGLGALRDFVMPAYEAMIAFGNGVDAIVWLMYMVAEDVSQKAADAAAIFAESAGKVLGMLKAGVDGLSALAGFTMPGYEAMVAFSNGVDAIVWLMYMVAEDVSQQATDAAAKFSEAASKVFGTLKSGVDGLTALADLKPIGEGAIQLFVALVDRLITDIAAASESFSADALAQAQKFATAAGAAVGILEKGVQGLLEVNSFAGVSEEAITRFAEGVKLAVAAMARLAAEFGADAVAAAKAFAQAAGESTDFLKKGADGLNKISEFEAVPVDGLKVFADGIRAMVAMVLNLSTVVTEQMIADAVRFSVGMDQVIQVVAGGLKAFKDLGVAAMNIQAFMVNFGLAVARLVTDFKNAAAPGAQNIGLAISLGIAAGITSGTPAIVNAVYAAINQAIIAAKAALGIASPSKVFQQQIGLQMAAGMAGGMTMGAPLVDRAVTDVSGRAVASAGAQGASSSSTTNIGGLTIVQQPGQNAQQLAQTVIAEIERRSKRKL